MKTQRYRGTRPLQAIEVLEGDGTKDSPAQVVTYICQHEHTPGGIRLTTIGKLTPLTEEERVWFGKEY